MVDVEQGQVNLGIMAGERRAAVAKAAELSEQKRLLVSPLSCWFGCLVAVVAVAKVVAMVGCSCCCALGGVTGLRLLKLWQVFGRKKRETNLLQCRQVWKCKGHWTLHIWIPVHLHVTDRCSTQNGPLHLPESTIPIPSETQRGKQSSDVRCSPPPPSTHTPSGHHCIYLSLRRVLRRERCERSSCPAAPWRRRPRLTGALRGRTNRWSSRCGHRRRRRCRRRRSRRKLLFRRQQQRLLLPQMLPLLSIPRKTADVVPLPPPPLPKTSRAILRRRQ